MSHLGRDLDRHLVWIETRTQDLLRTVEQLVEEGNHLMNDYELWDETQVDTIRRAIYDWADNCGRTIAHACYEATEFRVHLSQARATEG